MEDSYFLGGYYLIEGSPIKSLRNSSLLPEKIYTPSTCVCVHHLDLSVLTWVNATDRDRENYRTKLRLTQNSFEVLQKQVDQWFEEKRYGWGEVFIDLNLAREFATNYVSHIEDIKLIAIATTAKYRDAFLAEESLLGNNQIGICQNLNLNKTIKIDRGFLGYEVLGYDYGWFHSFVCNSLETDFTNKLGIKLNQYGLIDQYDQAIKATDYVNQPETGAEPVLWLPWAIIELSIQ